MSFTHRHLEDVEFIAKVCRDNGYPVSLEVAAEARTIEHGRLHNYELEFFFEGKHIIWN